MVISISNLKGIYASGANDLNSYHSGAGIVSPYEYGYPNGIDTKVPSSGKISLGNFNSRYTAAGSANFYGSQYWVVPPHITTLNVSYYSINPGLPYYNTAVLGVTPGDTLLIGIGGPGVQSYVNDQSGSRRILTVGGENIGVWSFSGNVDSYLNVTVGIADSGSIRSFSGTGAHVGYIAQVLAQNAGIYYYISQGNHGDLAASVSVQTVNYYGVDTGAAQDVVTNSYSGRDPGSYGFSYNSSNRQLSISQGDNYADEGNYNISIGLRQGTNLYCSYHA